LDKACHDQAVERPLCICPADNNNCYTLQGDHNWLTNEFGCGYAKVLSQKFILDPDVPFPYFEMKGGKVQQNLPLQLRDKLNADHIFNFLQKMDQLKKRLTDNVNVKWSKKHPMHKSLRRTFIK
jgi:hypothetical protein